MQRIPARSNTASSANGKPFPRYEPADGTVSSATSTPTEQKQLPKEEPVDKDVFDSKAAPADNTEVSKDEEDNDADSTDNGGSDLPIEIQSLMDRFLESLNSNSNSTQQPLTADSLSELYQDFYVHVESQIATHIAALATKLSREKSPTPSVSSQASAASRSSRRPPRTSNKSSDSLAVHQMLTPTEITDKRKARRLLELKKLALEEAVEKSVCEKSYSRLWRHRSTDDDERDEKVRSRAAALKVVGVDLHELLSTAMGADASASAPPKPSINLAEPQLNAARETLQTMNDLHYPVGKLKALKTTHKNIVEALSQMFPSTSSADEILPTLIYLLITSSPDSLNVVSNISFVQRFRTASKMDGEAAYCLTNLEAAISFLETVDLTSIRPNESKSTSRPSTPKTELADPLYHGLSGVSPQNDKKKANATSTDDSKSRQRTLSMILRAGPKPLGVAVESADLAYDKIQSALDGSFKFFFGRMKEQQATIAPQGGLEVTAPKTLEDARKLVSDTEQADDAGSIGEGSLAASENPSEDGVQTRGKALELIGGKKSRPRTHSLGSNHSGGSGKRVGFVDGKQVEIPATASGTSTPAIDAPATVAGAASTAPLAGALAYNTAAESMRTIGNSLSRFSAWGNMRGFGKAGPTTAPGPASPTAPSPGGSIYTQRDAALDVERKVVDPSLIDFSGVGPPISRFLELKDSKELNGYDTELLLRDYQRLAGLLKAMQQAQSGA